MAVTPAMPAALMPLLISAAEVDCTIACSFFAPSGESEVMANLMASLSCSLLVFSLVVPICVIAIWLTPTPVAVENPLMIPVCMDLSATRSLSFTPATSKLAVTTFAAASICLQLLLHEVTGQPLLLLLVSVPHSHDIGLIMLSGHGGDKVPAHVPTLAGISTASITCTTPLLAITSAPITLAPPTVTPASVTPTVTLPSSV